jgi:valyl-tRNA synthetase
MLKKLKKELETTQSQIKRLGGLLASDFAKKAPSQVVEKERIKLDTYKQTASKIKDRLDALR